LHPAPLHGRVTLEILQTLSVELAHLNIDDLTKSL